MREGWRKAGKRGDGRKRRREGEVVANSLYVGGNSFGRIVTLF